MDFPIRELFLQTTFSFADIVSQKIRHILYHNIGFLTSLNFGFHFCKMIQLSQGHTRWTHMLHL